MFKQLTLDQANDNAWKYMYDPYIPYFNKNHVLTLKAPIMTAADHKLCYIFPNFWKR